VFSVEQVLSLQTLEASSDVPEPAASTCSYVFCTIITIDV